MTRTIVAPLLTDAGTGQEIVHYEGAKEEAWLTRGAHTVTLAALDRARNLFSSAGGLNSGFAALHREIFNQSVFSNNAEKTFDQVALMERAESPPLPPPPPVPIVANLATWRVEDRMKRHLGDTQTLDQFRDGLTRETLAMLVLFFLLLAVLVVVAVWVALQ